LNYLGVAKQEQAGQVDQDQLMQSEQLKTTEQESYNGERQRSAVNRVRISNDESRKNTEEFSRLGELEI
jgi:hypothetical protein